MMRTKIVMTFGLVVLLAASSASAATISYGQAIHPYSDGGAQFPLLSGLIPGDVTTQVGTFTPFDSSLGTLQSFGFSIGGTGGAYLTLRNLEPGDYGFSVIMELQLISPDGTVISTGGMLVGGSLFGLQTVSEDGSVHPNDGTGVPFEMVFDDFNGLGAAGSTPGYFATEGLEHFVTNAPTTDQFTFTTRWTVRVGGPSFPGGATFAADTVAVSGIGLGGVTYEYTPVPEPSTALLVGLGMTWLGVVRSRRPS